MRSVLLSAGVGDMNIRAYLALMKPIRYGFGAPLLDRQRGVAEIKAYEKKIDAHPFIYTTLQLYGPSLWWSRLQRHWDDVVVADIGLAIAAHRAQTGHYPETLTEISLQVATLNRPIFSDGSELHYGRAEEGYRLWRVGEEGVPIDCWVVASVRDGSE